MCKGVTSQGWLAALLERVCSSGDGARARACVCRPYAVVCAQHIPQTPLRYRIPLCATKSQCAEGGWI